MKACHALGHESRPHGRSSPSTFCRGQRRATQRSHVLPRRDASLGPEGPPCLAQGAGKRPKPAPPSPGEPEVVSVKRRQGRPCPTAQPHPSSRPTAAPGGARSVGTVSPGLTFGLPNVARAPRPCVPRPSWPWPFLRVSLPSEEAQDEHQLHGRLLRGRSSLSRACQKKKKKKKNTARMAVVHTGGTPVLQAGWLACTWQAPRRPGDGDSPGN